MSSPHSSLSPRSSFDSEKDTMSSSSSIHSGISFETVKSTEHIFSTIEIIPSPDLLATRDGLRKRARHHFRSFCRHKSPKAISAISKEDRFSYAVIPPSVALQSPAEDTTSTTKTNLERAAETALIIDCNKSDGRIQETIECGLQTFPKQNIFVVGNGNSQCPINDTSRICTWFGVRHIWIPTRSKVTAQYVGIAAAHRFRYCLLIDEDVALPANFPVCTDRIEATEQTNSTPVKCIGYDLEDNDFDGHQIQSFRYQLSDLPPSFFGKSSDVGSASFPHGTISLWERRQLEECFHQHPGYRTSPNWFLGVNLAITLQKRSKDSDKQSTEAFRRCVS